MDYETSDDGELTRQALSGSKEAFSRLYDRYFDHVLGVCRSTVNRLETAKELTQESFLQAYLCLAHMRKPGSFKSWIHGIALNVCRSFLRKEPGYTASMESITGGSSEPIAGSLTVSLDPAVLAEQSDLRRVFFEAINRLSPTLRTPVVLYYYEHLSINEIALNLGASANAVKNRLYRARLYLREMLFRLFMEYSFDSYLTLWRKAMVKMRILDVVKHAAIADTHYVVLLLTEDQTKMLPIYIGRHEAEAIALGAKKRELPRPMTMDLMVRLLGAAGVVVSEVQVESLRDTTFYAVIKLKVGDTEKGVDSRPSDAIALALRSDSPIYASEEVLNRAGVAIKEEDLKKKKALKGIDDLVVTIDEGMRKMMTTLCGGSPDAELHIESLLKDD